MNNLQVIWAQIETWYTEHNANHLLRPPATEDAIQNLEERIGLSLTKDMKASLLVHDGIRYSPEQEVPSLERVYEEWRVWNQNVLSGHLPYSLEECAARGWNVEHWAPVTWDFGSDGFYIDLKTDADSFGSIFYLDHKEGPQFKIDNLNYPIFISYTSFLKHILQQVSSKDFDVGNAMLFDEEGGSE